MFNMIVFIVIAVSSAAFSQEKISTSELSDNLFLIYDPSYHSANIVALTGEDGVLLMDAGFRPSAKRLQSSVEKMDSGPVRKIIISHPHGDHTGALGQFSDTSEVICHQRAEKRLSKLNSKIISFSAEHEFRCNGVTVKCIALPDGHSPYDIIAWLPEKGWAYLGDMYLSESFPLIDTASGSKAGNLLKNLKKIHKILPPETRLVAGHGKNTNMAYLKSYIQMLEETIEIVRKGMRAGKTAQEMQSEDILKDYNGWGKFFSFITKETWVEQICKSYSS